AVLDLRAAVDNPARAIRVVGVEVDEVRTDVQDRDADVSQRLREELLQRGAAARVAADAHVVDEERDEGVEIARVRGDGVPGRELADLLVGEQPRDRARVAHAPRASRTRCSARSVSSCRKKWPPSIVISDVPAASAWAWNHGAGRYEVLPWST